MTRLRLRLGLPLLLGAAVLPGCSVGPRNGPQYDVTPGFLSPDGAGSVVPSNNSDHWNGEPMDLRTHR